MRISDWISDVCSSDLESTATVTINLQNDSTPTAGTVTARVDDDGLTGGNGPNVAADDLDANTDGNNNDIVFVGTLTGSASPDGPATFSLAAMDGLTASAGTGSFAETLTSSWNALNNTLTATSDVRSAERRLGKEGVSTCRSRWSADH